MDIEIIQDNEEARERSKKIILKNFREKKYKIISIFNLSKKNYDDYSDKFRKELDCFIDELIEESITRGQNLGRVRVETVYEKSTPVPNRTIHSKRGDNYVGD